MYATHLILPRNVVAALKMILLVLALVHSAVARNDNH